MPRLVQLVALAVAGAAAMVAGFLVLSSHAVDTARQQRLMQRSPVAADAGDPVIADYGRTADTVDGRQFLVIGLVPIDADAAPPPGLARWPEPGEAWLSPALAALDRDGHLRTRFGRPGGVIGLDGLADPNELYVYYRPVDAANLAIERWTPVTRWGGAPPDPGADRPSAMALVWLTVGLLAGPILLLSTTAGRTAPTSTGPRSSAGVLARAVDMVLPTVIGSAITAMLLWCALRHGVTLPITHYRVDGADLQLGIGRLTLLVLVASGGVAAMAATSKRAIGHGGWLSLYGRRLAGGGWSRALVQCGLVVLAAAAVGIPLPPSLLLAVLLATLTAWPFALSQGTAEYGRKLAVVAQRREARTLRAAAHWLRTGPVALAAFGALLAVTLTLSAFIQVTVTATGDEVDRAVHLRSVVGDQIIEVVGVGVPAERIRFIESVGADRVLQVVGDRTPTLSGTCGALARLGRVHVCPTTPALPTDLYDGLSEFGKALSTVGIIGTGDSPVPLVVAPSTVGQPPDVRAVLVLNADGAKGYQTISRLAFATLTLPWLSRPGQDWLGAVPRARDDAAWIRAITVLALMVIAAAGALSSAAGLSSRTGLLTRGARRRDTLAIAGWALLLPLLVLSAAAAALGYGATLAIRGAQGSGEIQFLMPLLAPALTLAAAVVSCLLVRPGAAVGRS